MIEEGLNVVAGVDLGDKHSHVCLIDLDGKIVERTKLRTSPAALERYFGGWAAMRVVLEAGCHANWIYRLLERLGHEPLMADTHRLALITQSLSKDDRSDAERLAELGLRMPEMLNAVEPRSLAIQRDRAVLKARETLVETRTKLINSLRGTVKSFGGRLPASSSEAFVKKAGPRVPDELRPRSNPCYNSSSRSALQSAAMTNRSRNWRKKNIPRRKVYDRSAVWGRSRRWRSC